MSDLVTWLRAQLDEDERLIGSDALCDTGWHWSDERFLAELKAKRQIIDWHDRAFANMRAHPDDFASKGAALAMVGVVKHLAAPYADREGYEDDWRIVR